MRQIIVPGAPVPQGSMRAFAHGSRAFVTTPTTSKLGRYRNDIRGAFGDPDLSALPIKLTLDFRFPRPASHFNAAGELKDATYKTPAPHYVTKKPDVDKLCRAVLDALTGFAYHDDSQVVQLLATKRWADGHPHTSIDIQEIGE